MQTTKVAVMRSLIARISLACLVLPLADRARGDEAMAVLEKAIQAHGGAARLERTKRGHIKAKWKGQRQGGAFQWTCEETFDLPGRYRQTIEGTVAGRALDVEYVVNGARSWSREGQRPPRNELGANPNPLERHWHARLAQLLQLRSKDTERKFLGEETKDGRRLVGIRAVSPRVATDLYFDKITGLLARAQWPQLNSVFWADTLVYDEYREVGGVRYPMHWQGTVQNASTLDTRIISLDFIDKIDEGVFAKPQVSGPAEPSAPAEPPMPPSDEAPARWDMRLIVATLAVGCFVAAVWLIVRGSKRKKNEMPPQ